MILVRASAGTGKTYRISVEFIATLLKMGHHTGYSRDDLYREILVITFTRKATSEIRERIFEHLGMIVRQEEGYRDILKSPLDDRQKDYLGRVFQSMRKNRHLLMIRTIDGFTQLVFQQLVAPAMQIDDFSVVNENDDDVYQRILEKVIEDDDAMTAFSNVFQKYIHRGKDLSAYRNLIKSMIDNRWLFDVPSIFEEPEDSADWYRKYRTALVDFIRENLSTSNALVDYLIGKGLKTVVTRNDIDFSNYETQLPIALNNDFLRIHAAEFRAEKTLGKRKTSEEQRDAYARNVFPLLVRGVIGDMRKEERIIRLIARIVFDEYDRLKMAGRDFTHNDILWFTYRALHQDEMGLIDPDSNMVTNLFYEFLSQRVRYIFIDEFQDTSILQWKLLEPLLIEISSGYGAEDYGGFIIVGDEKQAIYGWRGGERELLGRMRTVFHAIEEETLATCYRSQRRILDFVNRYFSTIADSLDDRDWQFHDVQHLPDKDEGYVEVRFDRYSPRSKTPREKEQCYKDFVEKMVAPKIASGAGDSAILARTNRDLDQIAQALDDIGIPYIHESSASLAEHRLVKPLIHLLRYVAWFDFYDLLVFLRSDFYRMGNERFNRLLLRYRAVEQPEHGIGFLNEMEDAIADDDLIEFLKNLVDSTQLYRILSLTIERHGSTGWSQVDLRNLARFMDYVQKFDAGVYDFLRELDRDRGSDALSQVGMEEGDAVRLMSIHKSKGLQFDTTFVYLQFSNRGGGAGRLDLQTFYRLSDRGTAPTDLIICNSEYVSVLKNCLTDMTGKPFDRMRELMECQVMADFTDEINALYVALTRAKNNLFVYTVQEAADAAVAIDKASKEPGTIKSLLAMLYREIGEELDENGIYRVGSVMQTEVVEEPDSNVADDDVPSIMKHIEPKNAFRERKVADPENAHLLIQAYRGDSIFKGELVHLCLSLVKTGAVEEFDAAREAAYRDFGGMYSASRIEEILGSLKLWTKEHPDIFSTEWSRVFNEISVFDDEDREYRIDRLLIDDARKKILIVDYKTGGIADAWQERKYVELLNGIKDNDYTVGFRYVEVKI